MEEISVLQENNLISFVPTHNTMASGGTSIIKYLMFFFNLLFVLSGIVILAIGITVQVAYKKYLTFLGTGVVSAPILLIIVGLVIFVVAFFGCCGAIKEQRFCICLFIGLLSVIFILEIAAGITAYMYRDEVDAYISKKMNSTMEQYNTTDSELVTRAWSLVQHDFQCCGLNGPEDWRVDNENIGDNLPDSCCREDRVGCGMDALNQDINPDKFYTDGCYQKLQNLADNNIEWIGGVAIGIAFIQLVGIVLACCLRKSLQSTYETV